MKENSNAYRNAADKSEEKISLKRCRYSWEDNI
jgi:hypothetical protein